jgi:tetratricopeptide (TPR) repeat protein
MMRKNITMLFPIFIILFTWGCASRRVASPAHLEEGLIAYEEKKWDKAVNSLEWAIKQNPQNVEAHFKRGVILQRQNKIDQALLSYRNVIQLNPNHFKAHYNLGNIYSYEKGNKGQATLHYQKFLEIAPVHMLAARTKNRMLELSGVNQKNAVAQQPVRGSKNSSFATMKEQLGMLQKAYEEKDLAALQRNTTMSEKRSRLLEQIFKNYSVIKVSVSDPFLTDHQLQSASAIITVTQLLDRGGNHVTPGAQWKETTVDIKKEGNQWGKITW